MFNNGISRVAVMEAERREYGQPLTSPRFDRFCTCECDNDDCEPTDYSRCLRCAWGCPDLPLN